MGRQPRLTRQHCLVCAAILLVAVPVDAQIRPSADQVSTGTEQPPTTQLFAPVDDLMTTLGERIASGIQFTYGLSDVADFKADPAGAFVRNPDDLLWKTTVTVKGSALVRSVSELHTAFTNAAEYKKRSRATDVSAPPIAAKSMDDLVAYFSRTRTSDRFARVMSGLTIAGSFLERAELDFGVDGAPGGANDRTKWSFDVSFDPAAIFVTAAQKKLTFEAIAAYLKVPGPAQGLPDGQDPCVTREGSAEAQFATRRACVRRLAGLSGGKAFLATLIPTVKLESIDEFDYALVGGQPVLFPEASREGALQNIHFTWDLLKIIKPSAARVDSVAALKALDDLEEVRKALRTSLTVVTREIVSRRDSFVATQLKASVATGDWSRPEGGAWEAEGLYLTKEGMVVGQPTCLAGKDECAIEVMITDKAGRDEKQQVKLKFTR